MAKSREEISCAEAFVRAAEPWGGSGSCLALCGAGLGARGGTGLGVVLGIIPAWRCCLFF